MVDDILLILDMLAEDIRTGKSFILTLKVTADSTRYSKEFAAFFEATYGEIPGDLPYAR